MGDSSKTEVMLEQAEEMNSHTSSGPEYIHS